VKPHGQLLTEDSNQLFLKLAYPSGEDRSYVDYYFEIHQPHGTLPFYINGLPSSNSLLSFNLNNQKWESFNAGAEKQIVHSGAQFLGHTSVLHTGIYPAGMHVFFVKLKPGIASLLFQEEARGFENEQVDLGYLWKHNFLDEQIKECAGFEQRIGIFKNVLMIRNIPSVQMEKIGRLNRMISSFSSLQLKDEKGINPICKANWITYPSARRDFIKYIGHPPKYCQKIARFKNALKEYKRAGFHFYYEDFGYTDFSHFAKESKQLTGLTPSSLL